MNDDVIIGLSHMELDMLIARVYILQDADGYYNEPLDILLDRLRGYKAEAEDVQP